MLARLIVRLHRVALVGEGLDAPFVHELTIAGDDRTRHSVGDAAVPAQLTYAPIRVGRQIDEQQD